MIESFTEEKVKQVYPTLSNYYYLQLLENGVTEYSMKDYQSDIRNAMFYFPFFVAVWFGTTPAEDLIDINFPYFFIKRLFNFYDYIHDM